MGIKFDANAAELLLKSMGSYCINIQKAGNELVSILNDTGTWSDPQNKAFKKNVDQLIHDLNEALILQSEYMDTFSQRINELRG